MLQHAIVHLMTTPLLLLTLPALCPALGLGGSPEAGTWGGGASGARVRARVRGDVSPAPAIAIAAHAETAHDAGSLHTLQGNAAQWRTILMDKDKQTNPHTQVMTLF